MEKEEKMTEIAKQLKRDLRKANDFLGRARKRIWTSVIPADQLGDDSISKAIKTCDYAIGHMNEAEDEIWIAIEKLNALIDGENNNV